MTAAEATSRVSRLSAVDVAVSVGARRLLSEVNLAVCAGETVGVAGLSGSGKTTLLHVLAGLLPPDSGYVAVDGRACSPSATTGSV